MPIQRAREAISRGRLRTLALRLLNASTLCAISTVSDDGHAHINTAYFAWSASFDIVWLSAPEAHHSRNLRRRPSVAIAVYDSAQKWGGSDRGIQIFGNARELAGRSAREAERLYGRRFRSHVRDELSAYRFYRLRPTRLKLFHERELGGATFVTARVARGGTLRWERTESYVSPA
ncbi:MAG: pyridoxamine 5'-phosphate oxidase family protein [Chloroflexota bacterium]|nr:pyridoxamine 5'-phosphate oxidase family protein [Chloroflexota bacterium]